MKAAIATAFTALCFAIGAMTVMNSDMSDSFGFASSENSGEAGPVAESNGNTPAFLMTLAPGENLLTDYSYVASAIDLPVMYQTLMEAGIDNAQGLNKYVKELEACYAHYRSQSRNGKVASMMNSLQKHMVQKKNKKDVWANTLIFESRVGNRFHHFPEDPLSLS